MLVYSNLLARFRQITASITDASGLEACLANCLCPVVNPEYRSLGNTLSNFISSASDRRKKTKLNNYTIHHNETKSIDRLSYT